MQKGMSHTATTNTAFGCASAKAMTPMTNSAPAQMRSRRETPVRRIATNSAATSGSRQ